jgi:NAD(P)-dependent dehydrogenase (short-subunit alcohol dehydrogenase family)
MKAIIIGGSSGMGKAAAKRVVEDGGEVLICSRSEEKLAAAAAHIGGPPGACRTRTLDNTDESAVRAFFESITPGEYDALIVTALGRAVHGAFLELEVAHVRDLFEGKFWGPYFCAKYGAPRLRGDTRCPCHAFLYSLCLVPTPRLFGEKRHARNRSLRATRMPGRWRGDRVRLRGPQSPPRAELFTARLRKRSD